MALLLMAMLTAVECAPQNAVQTLDSLVQAPVADADVSTVQSLLEKLGYNCGGVDGILGPMTEKAIQAYQKDRRLVRSTTIGDRPSQPEIRVNIPEYKLSLIDKGKVVRQFDIAVGTPYEQTPLGTFSIFTKIENPTWYPGSNFADQTPVPPGPENPLGTRWMEFVANYGIHGTNKDWDICYPVSGGCIRMHDAEARELYRLVDIGTPVAIVYETVKVIEKTDGLYVKLLPDIYRKNTSNPEAVSRLMEPFLAAGYKPLANIITLPPEIDEAVEIRVAIKQAAALAAKTAASPQALVKKPAK